MEGRPREPGSEEYLHSEKYEIRERDYTAPGNIAGYVAAKLGTPVADADVSAAFARLGFTVKASAAGFSVLVPSFRSDVTRPIDLVEEFIRIHGTDKVPAGRPIAPLPGEEDALTSVFTREVSARLVGAGFTECCHYSFRDAAELERTLGADKAALVAMDNPLTAEQTHLRASLVPGLAGALALNLSVHADPRGLFEVGTVFRPQADGTVLLRIKESREHSDSVVASSLEVPDRTAAESLRGARIFVSRSSFPTPASDEYYFSLTTTSSDPESKNNELCQRAMSMGLTWEGVTNGEGCVKATVAPAPTQ